MPETTVKMSAQQNNSSSQATEDTVRVRDLVQQAREVRTKRRQEYTQRVVSCADAFLDSLHVDFNQLIQDSTVNGRTYASFFQFHLTPPNVFTFKYPPTEDGIYLINLLKNKQSLVHIARHIQEKCNLDRHPRVYFRTQRSQEDDDEQRRSIEVFFSWSQPTTSSSGSGSGSGSGGYRRQYGGNANSRR